MRGVINMGRRKGWSVLLDNVTDTQVTFIEGGRTITMPRSCVDIDPEGMEKNNINSPEEKTQKKRAPRKLEAKKSTNKTK